MRRTNVFLEVEDSVYDIVIEPHKRAKTFSKLVAALLKGYIEDEYVRAYGDELVEDLRKASVDSLDDVLGSMQESLANMGLFTDELQMVNNKGSKIFSKKVEEHTESVKKSEEFVKRGDFTSQEESYLKEENEKLQKEMEELKKQMSDMSSQNNEILSVLKNLSFGSVVKEEPKVENIVKEVEEVEEIIKEPIKEVAVSVEKPVGEVQKEEEEDAPTFDMSFLTDAAISF